MWKNWISQVELLSNWEATVEIPECFCLEREVGLNVKYCSCSYCLVGPLIRLVSYALGVLR